MTKSSSFALTEIGEASVSWQVLVPVPARGRAPIALRGLGIEPGRQSLAAAGIARRLVLEFYCGFGSRVAGLAAHPRLAYKKRP
jgi:hypothetical protein